MSNEHRARRCGLAEAVHYLEEDRKLHLAAHGKWALDPGKLEAAILHGGFGLAMGSIDDEDLRAWEARLARGEFTPDAS